MVAEEYGKKLPEYIRIENAKNLTYQKILTSCVDAGEASAIALALEKKDCLLIIDDNKGRREAKQLGLNFTGTLGVLIAAKNKGHIKSLKNLIDDIKKTDFRIRDSLLKDAIRRAKE